LGFSVKNCLMLSNISFLLFILSVNCFVYRLQSYIFYSQ
jgi:hypothetical protein